MKSVDTQTGFTYALSTMPKLWKRPSNGVYYAVWQENGKQRKRSLKTREKRAASRHFINFKRDIIRKKISPIGARLNVTLSQFRDEFLEHIERTLSPATYEGYKTALNHAIECWGDIPVGHITTRLIDRYTQDLARSGLKSPTVNKNRRHLKGALNKAYDWDYLRSQVKFPPAIREEEMVRFLTKAELGKVLSKIPDPEFYDVAMFAVYTALRSGEILRLTWNDIDNPKGFLRITAKQKNRSDSWIPINDGARAVLGRCKARGRETRLFRFETRQTISKMFKKAARAAGVGNARFHDLRHTFGSHAAMEGLNEKTIQDLMRHKSMASTMVYTRVSPAHLVSASSKINYGPMPIPMQKTGQKQDSEG